MRLLLDTHAFLWFANNDPRLSDAARLQIGDPDNERLLSMASLWEVAIKISIGKLKLPASFDQFFQTQLPLNATTILEIELDHLNTLVSLPFHHRDPFDRLLVAQTLTEKIPLVSADATLDAYGINRLW